MPAEKLRQLAEIEEGIRNDVVTREPTAPRRICLRHLEHQVFGERMVNRHDTPPRPHGSRVRELRQSRAIQLRCPRPVDAASRDPGYYASPPDASTASTRGANSYATPAGVRKPSNIAGNLLGIHREPEAGSIDSASKKRVHLPDAEVAPAEPRRRCVGPKASTPAQVSKSVCSGITDVSLIHEVGDKNNLDSYRRAPLALSAGVSTLVQL